MPAASPYAVGVKGPGEITITALSKPPFLRPLVPGSNSNEVGACRRPLTIDSWPPSFPHMFPDHLALLLFGGFFPGFPVFLGGSRFGFPENGPYPMAVGGVGHEDEFFPEQVLVLFHQCIPLIHVLYIVHPLEIIQAVPQIHGNIVGLGDFFLFLICKQVPQPGSGSCRSPAVRQSGWQSSVFSWQSPPCIFML